MAGNIKASISVVRMFLGSLGKQPGRESVLSMLIDSNEFPSADWVMTHERTFRTGAGRNMTDQLTHAREAGSITARRGFSNGGHKRTVTTSVVPYVSALDARAMVPKTVDQLIRKPFSRMKSTRSNVVENAKTDRVQADLVYEEQFQSRQRSVGMKLLAGSVGEIVWILNFAALEDWWTWDELEPIAASQVRRIERFRSDQPSQEG